MIRDDFPILKTKVNNHQLVYLDNAATMQMPLPVMKRMEKFYSEENSNIHRGIHTLSENATWQYEDVRETVRQFIGAKKNREIIFTQGTTASINMAAGMLAKFVLPGDEIAVTQMEHHSNYIVWQQLARHCGAKLRVIPVNNDGTLNMAAFFEIINEKIKVAAFSELSNVTGIENPIEAMIKYIHKKCHAYILVDGAQGIVHCQRKMRELKPDFYCFSGHKLGAPAGTGVLYIREDVQEKLAPVAFGGGIVKAVTLQDCEYLDSPWRFEPGTPNYAGIIGLGTALDYWMKKEQAGCSLANTKQTLLAMLEDRLADIEGIHILGNVEKRKGSLSFYAEGIHSFDFCRLLNQYGIAARSGHLCAMPYLNTLGCQQAVRFSAAPYNTSEEIEQTADVCRQIFTMFRG